MSEKALPLEMVRPLSFSAASALVRINDVFCTVSDDQLQLELFQLDPDQPLQYHRLLPGELPKAKKARKAVKPDFEALLLITKEFGFSCEGVLAIPSGSTDRRRRGVFVPLNAQSQLQEPRVIDLSELFTFLESQVPELNIEGAVFTGTFLKLFQRGNGASAENAVFDLNARVFLQELCENSKITKASFLKTTKCSLPTVRGLATSFTDAATDPRDDKKIWFLAAAEDSASTYEDGPFGGALLGCMNAENEVTGFWPLDILEKPEGLFLDKSQNEFFIVTDTDNPEIPSKLLKGSLPRQNL